MSTDAVIEYYDQCHVDYKILWRSHRNLCIHFGYFDDEHDDHHSAVPNMNRVLAERAAITASDEVLDAGCGVGGSSMWLAENKGATACGINIQPLHLELARAEAARRGLEDLVRFEERNYCDSGLPDGSFDVVWALESVCHCEDKLAFINEAYRVLRPGGRLMVADFFQFERELESAQEQRMRRWLDGWALPNLAHVDDFADGLRSAGFEAIEQDDITANVMRSSRRIWKASLIIWPGSRPLELVGVRSKRQTANVVASYHQYTTIRDGLWGYSVFAAVKPGN
jgi:cyclopropane fatty-acyl-phospholipid synthase-like methyltransferase